MQAIGMVGSPRGKVNQRLAQLFQERPQLPRIIIAARAGVGSQAYDDAGALGALYVHRHCTSDFGKCQTCTMLCRCDMTWLTTCKHSVRCSMHGLAACSGGADER